MAFFSFCSFQSYNIYDYMSIQVVTAGNIELVTLNKP